MILKKLIVSLLIITGVGATAIASTRALLTDQATLGANTFSTASIDLLISNGQSGTFADSQVGFTESLLPGETETNYLRLRNESDDTDLSIEATSASISGEIDPNDVIVTFTPVDTDEQPTGDSVTATLQTWLTPTSLGTIIPAGNTTVSTQEYKMDVKLDEDVATGGESITFDFVFTGTQVAP